jgi:hypothetical protein
MNKYRIEIKWAFIFVVMSLVWMTIEKLVGLHDKHIDKHETLTNLIAIPAIAIYILALFDKRKNYYENAMTYKQGFRCGLVITIIVALLSPLTQIITSKIITPDYFNNAINYTVANGRYTQAEAEQFFNLNNYIVYGIIGALVMGLITTAIFAFFVRNRK